MQQDTQISPSKTTGARFEQKFLVASSLVGRLRAYLDRQMRRHDATNAHSSEIVDHWVTTVYFDTASRHIFRAQSEHGESMKVRAREYYDVLDSLAELATEASSATHTTPWTWLEFKWKESGETRKQRVAVTRAEIPELVLQQLPDKDGPARAVDTVELSRMKEALAQLEEKYGEQLRPDCIVSYRRWAWEDPRGDLRITLDTHLVGYEATSGLWEFTKPLTRAELGQPQFSLDAAVLEIKSTKDLPEWIVALTQLPGVRPAVIGELNNIPFSKFLCVGVSIHGPAST